ncbi:MAG: MerR family transcriptional regulator [Flavobacterium sp.]|nr:MerR family transcriptional regulator [Flavobacterium sp.]
MSTTAKYSIKDLEVLTNIKSHTIRIWEKRYQLLSPARTDTNIRHYDNADLRKLLNVSILNQNGYKISKIAEMNDGQIKKIIEELTIKKSDESNLIDGLIVGMIDLDEVHLNKVFAVSVGRIGFEKTITEVIFPLFGRIGIMWQIGVINPAQEHFISHFVRQKLIGATDALQYSPNLNLPKAILFLPDNELHELSLLLYNYSLRARDYQTVYLSQSVPVESLQRIVDITQPDLLICTITNSIDRGHFAQIVTDMCRAFHGKIFISGAVVEAEGVVIPKNVKPFRGLQSLLDRIAAN